VPDPGSFDTRWPGVPQTFALGCITLDGLPRLTRDGAEEFSCCLGGREYRGWRALRRTIGPLGRTARSQAATLRAGGMRLFVGPDDMGPTLYAIPDLPAADVALAMRVGSHNAGSRRAEDEQVVAVHQFLTDVARRFPFDVSFADEAGFQADFLVDVPRADSEGIVRRAVMVAPDSPNTASQVLREAGLPMPVTRQQLRFGPTAGQVIEVQDEFAAMCEGVHRARVLRLWWD
jgi:hypothetical protein